MCKYSYKYVLNYMFIYNNRININEIMLICVYIHINIFVLNYVCVNVFIYLCVRIFI